MTTTSYLAAMATAIAPQYVEKIKDKSYVSWATAVAMAGRPNQRIVHAKGRPAVPLFGGAIVGIDMDLPCGKVQRTWLPALDNRNEPIAAIKVTTRDITDTIARCRAKAIAMVTGFGMSLYAGYEGNGPLFSRELGLGPSGDPAGVQPIVSHKGSVEYLDWASALAAARVTDPDFHWEVQEHDHNTDDGEILRMPALQLARGYVVSVLVNWRGKEHQEILPIMDMSNRPIAEPTVADWNKAVMRCLTKAIAVVTGYGLSLYAKEDLTGLAEAPDPGAGGHQAAPAQAHQPAKDASTPRDPFAIVAPARAKGAASPPDDPLGLSAPKPARRAAVDLAIQVKDLIREGNRDKTALLAWLAYPPETALEDLPEPILIRAIAALRDAATRKAA